MKNLNKTLLIALGMSVGMALPMSATASPDEDVTIRMMEQNEHAADSVTSHIELPEMADDHAREHAADGLATANENHNGDMDQDRDRDHDMEREEEHEREMDREDDHEREMDMDRDDRKDVEHNGIDREEIEREGFDDMDHGRGGSGSEFEAPEFESPEIPDMANDNGMPGKG